MPQSQLFSDVQNKFMQDCSSHLPLKYFVFQGFISYDMASVHSGLIRRGCVGIWQRQIIISQEVTKKGLDKIRIDPALETLEMYVE